MISLNSRKLKNEKKNKQLKVNVNIKQFLFNKAEICFGLYE